MGAEEHATNDRDNDFSSDEDDDFYYCERAKLNLFKCR